MLVRLASAWLPGPILSQQVTYLVRCRGERVLRTKPGFTKAYTKAILLWSIHQCLATPQGCHRITFDCERTKRTDQDRPRKGLEVCTEHEFQFNTQHT
jgi:hypothetical protein